MTKKKTVKPMSKPNSSKKVIACKMCDEYVDRWNNHHFAKQKKKVCVECHSDIHYYMALCEVKKLTWKNLTTIKNIISKRKRMYD